MLRNINVLRFKFLRSYISFWFMFYSFFVLMIHTYMFVMIEFQQHTPTFMPSSLMKILKKTGQNIDSCCYTFSSLLPLQNYSVFSPSCNCPLSITPVLYLSSFVSADNFPQYKIPFRNLDSLLHVLTQKIS